MPKGIPIGRVASAEGSAQDVFRRIRLDPLAPLDEVELVLIQVTFQPAPPLEPDGEDAEETPSEGEEATP